MRSIGSFCQERTFVRVDQNDRDWSCAAGSSAVQSAARIREHSRRSEVQIDALEAAVRSASLESSEDSKNGGLQDSKLIFQTIE